MMSRSDFNLENALCQAVLAGDIHKARLLLDKGADPNILVDDASAIHLAAGVDDHSGLFTHLFLQHSADPNLPNSEGITPLLVAASYGHCDALKLLIDYGGNLYTTDSEGANAVILAQQSGCLSCCLHIQKRIAHLAETETHCTGGREISDSADSIIPEMTDDSASSDCVGSCCENSAPTSDSDTSAYSVDSRASVTTLDKAFCRLSLSGRSSNGGLTDKSDSFDLTSISSVSSLLSETSSICSRHSIRIERRPLDIRHEELPVMLVESQFIPDQNLPNNGRSSSSSSSGEWQTATSFSDGSSANLNAEVCGNVTDVSNSRIASTPSRNFDQSFDDGRRCQSPRISGIETSDLTDHLQQHQQPTPVSMSCDLLECRYLNDASVALDSWEKSSPKEVDRSSSRVEDVVVDLRKLSDDQLRDQLLAHGDKPGPITACTRQIYESKLARYLAQNPKKAVPPKRSDQFLPELSAALNRQFDFANLSHLEHDLVSPFANPDASKLWREGIQKCSFNYLLLDPRVTQNLPVRVKTIGTEAGFEAFIRAIFYIGKGKRSRPYEHFKEALSCLKKDNSCSQPSRKVAQILEIWQAGLGVISLHIFQNVIPCEAYTREACMIEAFGLERLTNLCRGQLYGPAQSWDGKRIRQAGVVMLRKAFYILLFEGERQIFVANLR